MKKSELREIVREVIRKVGDEYAVYPKKGGKRLGTHKTRKGAEDQMTAIHISKYSENLDPSYKHDGKAVPYGSGYRPAKKVNELKCKYGQYFCPHDKVYKCRKSPKKTRSEDVHKPMNPGILKKRLGKLSCSKVRAERSKLKDKGTTYAKALQRYLNYHCQ